MAARITKDDFEEKVLRSKLPVLVDFYSDSCVACKRISPVLGNLEDDYENRIEVFKVNTNYDAELVEDYTVMSNPTLILFKSGKEQGRHIGAAGYKDLEKWVLDYLD